MTHPRIRALIVDDEPLARSNLKVLLRLDADIESIGECGCGAEAVAQIRALRPDLVFLDVQMPECGGFDVLKILKAEGALPVIVLVTAYDEYALRAFDAGALDYLLKPFDDARFALAMQRAKASIAAQSAQSAQSARMAQAAQPPALSLAVRSAGQVNYVRIQDLDWVEAADYYVCLHAGAKAHLLRQSMAELEQSLDPRLFCRIHRSTIVNLRRVRALKVSVAGEYEVLLEGGQKLRVSRRFRKELQARMRDFGAAAPGPVQNAAG
ncbi:MAG TPA: LytTR family DNA-binding domain-containing protein [Steroidobacteraceae bacterium]|jgi:two-component system LytT family response regulator|nr:LytTR family DNA-binding domain-containing protein [Steroidobacteraceae bacterium]